MARLPSSAAPISWVAFDFEWFAPAGALPVPRMLTAIESATGRAHRYGEAQLRRLRHPPFPIGPEVVCCAFSAASDLVPWLVLRWGQLPDRLVCTYAEHRVRYNGICSEFDDDLLGACARRGIAYTSTEAIKKRWHERFADPHSIEPREEEEGLDYCLADTQACLALAQEYEKDIWWERALLYGEYAKALAVIEFAGIPLDTEALSLLQRNAGGAKLALIEEGDREYDCYEKGHLRNQRVWAFAKRNNISWPALPAGAPVLADEELKTLAARYLGDRRGEMVEGFRQLRKTVGALRSNKYAAGPDGRSHVSLHGFGTKTGRNAPKGSQSIFLGPAWMRGFMRPNPGDALVYLDFEAEEFAIRAAQSGDPAMIRAYQSGDPYMATGILMGLAPVGATKHTHPDVRALCKVLVLAIGYGMSAWGLAQRLGIEEEQAADLIQRYHEAFSVARAWSEGGVAYAKAHKGITTPFGWRMYVPRNINPRTLLNWPMQSLGSDLLRLVAIALVDAGIKVVSLIHDAVLIEVPIAELDATVQQAVAIMGRASEQVVGMPLRVDIGSEDEPHIFPYPARFRDKREGDMYNRMLRLLREVDEAKAQSSDDATHRQWVELNRTWRRRPTNLVQNEPC
jgi:hypothetical protein